MRHEMPVPILVVAVFFCGAIFAVPPGQEVLATVPDGDSWSMVADAERAIWLVDDFERMSTCRWSSTTQ